MRTDAAGQSALLMLDVAETLVSANIDYAVVGAMAAAVYGMVRASLDADAIISATVQRSRTLRRTLEDAGFEARLRIGDHDDPIAALLAVSDSFGNRVDLLIGLRGFDSAAFSRTQEVPFCDATLRFIGREDFIAMKAFAGSPQDIADARSAIEFDRTSLDVELLRNLARGYGREAAGTLERLLEDHK